MLFSGFLQIRGETPDVKHFFLAPKLYASVWLGLYQSNCEFGAYINRTVNFYGAAQ
ncbi:MAG: hypothetical protein JWR23_2887 [Mucilaginibacter sp.]|nr:hypothetical protein [Mucilaginibacter sp.]